VNKYIQAQDPELKDNLTTRMMIAADDWTDDLHGWWDKVKSIVMPYLPGLAEGAISQIPVVGPFSK